MKRREILWMLLPCAFLALVALWLRGRPGATINLSQDFALVAEKIESEPLTPHEVWQGFDTKLKITLNHEGRAPTWWGKPNATSNYGTSADHARLAFRKNGQWQTVKLPSQSQIFIWRPDWDQKQKRYVARYLTGVAKVPQHLGAIILEAQIAPVDNNDKPLCKPLRFQHALRKKGEIAQVPKVSKDPQIKLEKAVVDDMPLADKKANNSSADTRLFFTFRYSGPESGRHFVSCQGEVFDEKGNPHPIGQGSSLGAFDGLGKTDPQLKRVTIDLELAKVPRSAGRLVYKTEAYANNGWPLTFDIPLRDDKGRILKTPRTPAPFSIQNIVVRAADAEETKETGADVVVEANLLYKGQDAAQNMQWQGDFSPHLVDEKGKEYWTFKTPYPVGPQPMGAGIGYTETPYNKRITMSYGVPLNQVPSTAKRLKFKAEISVGNSARVPVEVMLRDGGKTLYSPGMETAPPVVKANG